MGRYTRHQQAVTSLDLPHETKEFILDLEHEVFKQQEQILSEDMISIAARTIRRIEARAQRTDHEYAYGQRMLEFD